MSHSIRAVAVTALLAALPLTLQAQQADLTLAQVATIKREVADAVHTYYRLFSERNMQAMGDRVYHVPWMQLGARGVDVDTTAEAVVKRNSSKTPEGWKIVSYAGHATTKLVTCTD